MNSPITNLSHMTLSEFRAFSQHWILVTFLCGLQLCWMNSLAAQDKNPSTVQGKDAASAQESTVEENRDGFLVEVQLPIDLKVSASLITTLQQIAAQVKPGL